MLDHDDVLAPNALARLGNALRDHPEASFAYSDNDVLRRDGRLADPFYKPDFSPERLRNHNYVLHCVMAPLARVRQAGGFRAGFDGAQDHDLLLRLSELGPAVHVPEVLYHWREAPASVASDPARQAVRVRGRCACRAGALRPGRHRRDRSRRHCSTVCTASGAPRRPTDA